PRRLGRPATAQGQGVFGHGPAALGAAAAVVSLAWGQSKTGCRPLEAPLPELQPVSSGKGFGQDQGAVPTRGGALRVPFYFSRDMARSVSTRAHLAAVRFAAPMGTRSPLSMTKSRPWML